MWNTWNLNQYSQTCKNLYHWSQLTFLQTAANVIFCHAAAQQKLIQYPLFHKMSSMKSHRQAAQEENDNNCRTDSTSKRSTTEAL